MSVILGQDVEIKDDNEPDINDLLVEPLTLKNLELRLARTEEEKIAAQKLRYRVFYEEMGAKPDDRTFETKRDWDQWDPWCHHLLVIDTDIGHGPEGVVGTYRLIPEQAADKIGRFYSSDEYEIRRILDFPGKILELGRSCVDEKYRTRPTLQLLWRGIAAYVDHFDIKIMFGCASLHGADPKEHAVALSYLYYHHLAPPGIRTRAVEDRYVGMRMMPRADIDPRRAVAQLPPLIKGYIRMGGFVGDGAVIDHQFNTTDVCIIVKTDWMTDKYRKHFFKDKPAMAKGDENA